MIREAIAILVEGKSLTMTEASAVMEEIMEGRATAAQLGAFLIALRIKGETPDEIAGLASVMRAKALPVKTPGPLLDVVGTGGDGCNTFNISTAAALVAAGAGIKVAKHGNRAASSQCGSADVLEKLGVKIDLDPDGVQKCIQEVGIGFMFAPAFHPAMKYAGGPRKEIGIRTVFNILGPLTNPARAENQITGVPSIDLGEKIIAALMRLGSQHALVVHGLNGMDEITITGESLMWEAKDGKLIADKRHISPEALGLNKASSEAIRGGTAEENAKIIRSVLGGEKGARRDAVVLNAAAALVAGNKAEDLQKGVAMAQEVIDSGQSLKILERFIECSQSVAGN